MTLGFVLGSIALGAPCEQTYDDQELLGLIHTAQDAFAALDAPSFTTRYQALMEAVPCASEPLSTASAGGLHRIRTFAAFLDRVPAEVERSAWSWAAVEATPPLSTIAPKGHPLRNAWETARSRGRSNVEAMPVPDAHRLLIDGADTLERPVERPVFMQLLSQGEPTWTVLVHPGEPNPGYEQAPEASRGAYENTLYRAPRKPIELPITAGLLAAGAIGTYSGAWVARRSFLKSAMGPDLVRTRNTTNALAITATGLGIAAVGVGVWAGVKW